MSFARLTAAACGWLFAAAATAGVAAHRLDPADDARVKSAVDAAVRPLMESRRVPGVAVGVILGARSYRFDYGVASARTGRPVDAKTLFEIGSISKVFTATLASWAQVRGELAWSDPLSTYLPALRGRPFGQATLLQLATHTPGGLPLQVPDAVHDPAELMRYFQAWRPGCPPDTCRTYSNPGIGALGMAVAAREGRDLPALLAGRLWPALGLSDTFIDVPAARRADYAEGTTQDDRPARVSPGLLSAATYGVKTTASDLLRVVRLNLEAPAATTPLGRAIAATQVGHRAVGGMTQDLVWEQYAWPAPLEVLLAGNSPAMGTEPQAAQVIDPPHPPDAATWINKTGSTNGFGAYVAFVPQARFGIVILANRNVPIADRVTAAYRIFMALSP